MERSEAQRIVEGLIAAFAWGIDRGAGKGLERLLTREARLILPAGPPTWRETATLEGREAIVGRWAVRPDDRVSRHLFLNIEVTEASPDRIVSRCVGIGYRHDGPDLGPPWPLIVADYDDICVEEDGAWRFQERKVTPVFVSPSLT